jgi:hypothetical protein
MMVKNSIFAAYPNFGLWIMFVGRKKLLSPDRGPITPRKMVDIL